jgi:predicted SprT family Zn-dependent metalloprotease
MPLELWESELRKGYDRINWEYKLKLYPPLIQIVDVSSFWGQWSPHDRKIKISKRLIDNHSWDIVLNILKHEMAHQIDSDKFNGSGDHGEGFKHACKMLCLPIEFQNSNLDVGAKIFNWRETALEDDAQDENHKMIRRVEKLLSLAQSSNEHESLVAMEKVMQIYQIYNVNRIDRNIKSNYIYAIINLKKLRVESYQSAICNVIQEFYFTDVVFSRLYDSKTFKSYQTIELFGTKENVQMAEYVFHFLNSKVLDLWNSFSKINKLSVKFKRSYMIGVLRGFKDKLKSIKTESMDIITSGKMLKLKEQDADLHQFIRQRYPRLSKGKSSNSSIYSEAFESGKKDGKSIVINKGIENSFRSLKNLFLT